MLYSLSASSPKLFDTPLIIAVILAIITCLVSIFAIILLCVLSAKKDKEEKEQAKEGSDKGETKHRSLFPVFMLASSSLFPIGASVILLIELALIVWEISWMVNALKKLKKPVEEEEAISEPEPEPMPIPSPIPVPQSRIVYTEHKASDEEEALVAELIREDISVEDAHDAITDEVAMHFVDVEEIVTDEEKRYRKKNIINIDILSDNFNNGDTVTLSALIEKKLLPKDTDHVKVLARGHLNKHLIVEAQNYSADAIKMIILTGGKVIKVK